MISYSITSVTDVVLTSVKNKMVRFFPITYHSYEDARGVSLLFFVYLEDGRKASLRFRYTHWYYASIAKHSARDIAMILSARSGIDVDTDNIHTMRSTVELHSLHRVVKVYADTLYAKQESIRLLANHGIKVHEIDKDLTPLLKLMAEKDIRRYQWMEVDTKIAADRVSKFKDEYIGDISTLRTSTEEVAPPKFSTFSYDLETHSTQWNKMPDAKHDPNNAICIACCTFDTAERYEEHAIIFGPDISDVYTEYRSSDIIGENKCVYIHVCKTELDLILKIFDLIDTLDPDIIVGHNIMGFDNPYINDRYKFLVLNSMSGTSSAPRSIRIPNVSRLNNHSVSIKNVEWNNSQVAVNGIYFDLPGRIWIDTLIISARGLFGQLENNKLETLATEILGMSKNDMPVVLMFKTFDIHMKWEMIKNAPNPDLVPFKKRDVAERIRLVYEEIVKVYNHSISVPPKEITLSHLNSLIQLLNVMNQRTKKQKIFSKRDIGIKASELNITSHEYVRMKYREYRDLCTEALTRWNIPLESKDKISDEKMINVCWYIVTLYCLQDTRIPFQIIDQQGLTFMLREQSSIFSVDITDVYMRGQVYTTTSSQYRYNYQNGYMMDFGPQGGPVTPYEYGGGFVGKGVPGLKIVDNDSFIYVLDFASLYPTIIIAYNLCYTTYVPTHMTCPYLRESEINPDYIWLRYESIIAEKISQLREKISPLNLQDDLESRIRYVEEQVSIDLLKREPYSGNNHGDDIDKMLMDLAELTCITNASYELKYKYMCIVVNVNNIHTKSVHSHWFLRSSVLPGVIPMMLWDQYLTRKVIKGKMSAAFKAGNIAMGITYNAQQDGLKRGMNATYGGFGTKTNRLALFPVAEAITWIGSNGIQLVNVKVEEKGLGTTVYNDTDSAMILVKDITARFGRSTKLIKEHGLNAAKELSGIFPKPMSLECENFFVSFFLKAPKMYAAIKWDGKSVEIGDYTHDYTSAMNLLYVKGMAPVRKDKYKYLKDLYRKVLYYVLIREDVNVIVELLEVALVQVWSLSRGIARGSKSEVQYKKYLARIENLFGYNMGVSPKAAEGGNGTMAKWVNIYGQKYGRKPVAGERFNLLVTTVNSGPDMHKHTRSPSKLVTMEWLLEENRQLDVQHYIEQFANDGNIVEIMHIAYPEDVPRDCIKNYYLKKLKVDGEL